jgi:hypothetical protein
MGKHVLPYAHSPGAGRFHERRSMLPITDDHSNSGIMTIARWSLLAVFLVVSIVFRGLRMIERFTNVFAQDLVEPFRSRDISTSGANE